MACGGERHCKLVRNEEQAEMIQLFCNWLAARAARPGEKGLDQIPAGQVLRLRLFLRVLEAAGDPDREFLTKAEVGRSVGILDPPPRRTPHVFEEQLQWPLDNLPWEPGLRWVPNYSSVKEHVEFAREKFE